MNYKITPLIAIFLFGLNAAAAAQQYTNLLANRSLSQWMLPNGNDVEKGWQFESDGTLHLASRGGDIITREEFGDFDLWFEFRISEKGNNGIKYRVRKFGSSMLGCEYQIQDDAAFPKLPAKHYTASLYDVFDKSSAILERKYLDLNDFSVGRIVVQNHRIRHWMNGNLIIDELDCSPRFEEAVQQSKFRDVDGFGRNQTGRLMLTDHNSEVWFRNVFVRRLSPVTCDP